MTKNPKTKKKLPRNNDGTAMEWEALYRAFHDSFEWALDVAANLARDFPEEVEAVERVRAFMRKRIAGVPSHVTINDVLFTFGLLIGAIDRDIGPVGPSSLAMTRLKFPGANGWDIPHVFGTTTTSRFTTTSHFHRIAA